MLYMNGHVLQANLNEDCPLASSTTRTLAQVGQKSNIFSGFKRTAKIPVEPPLNKTSTSFIPTQPNCLILVFIQTLKAPKNCWRQQVLQKKEWHSRVKNASFPKAIVVSCTLTFISDNLQPTDVRFLVLHSQIIEYCCGELLLPVRPSQFSYSSAWIIDNKTDSCHQRMTSNKIKGNLKRVLFCVFTDSSARNQL